MRKMVVITFLIYSALSARTQDTQKWVDALVNVETRSGEKVYNGTAIFVKYNSRYYLLTAAHVIRSEDSSKKNQIADRIYFRKDYYALTPNDSSFHLLQMPKLKEELKPYIITDARTDLGLVCLGVFGGYVFKDLLLKNQYQAVDFSSIDTSGTIKTGDVVYALGYPKTAIRGYDEWESSDWSSGFKSVPVRTSGRVYSASNKHDFIATSMAAYHGFSGGPLIFNGRMVGIASKMSWNETKPANKRAFADSYPVFKKATLLPELFRKLDAKIDGIEKIYPGRRE